ncbi:transcriptional regulators LysR family [Vibrio variabilis]|uniref:Transcriptional regulators LysR family n=1 Tax=Vibrio variabilis TaxID=990271 RepID=A0ABQ0JI40_9VIBR|nr:transcriptional regulators LysR family [Vibrio variabilis]
MIDNDLNLLKLIKVLSEEKQTVLAAKKMKISQPTVSAMLKKLRSDFDDQLFIRNNNELEPTKRCEEILAELPDIFDKLEGLYINKALGNKSGKRRSAAFSSLTSDRYHRAGTSKETLY